MAALSEYHKIDAGLKLTALEWNFRHNKSKSLTTKQRMCQQSIDQIQLNFQNKLMEHIQTDNILFY